jgi:hypothetical protein
MYVKGAFGEKERRGGLLCRARCVRIPLISSFLFFFFVCCCCYCEASRCSVLHDPRTPPRAASPNNEKSARREKKTKERGSNKLVYMKRISFPAIIKKKRRQRSRICRDFFFFCNETNQKNTHAHTYTRK